ncbi:hypothetical protein [Holophaga foetida]|uniref:hypothetical protein n=1 Tax=Holophaga foetida TaxID=35839 RepID=UPI0002471C1C|nr:hypothetical protein [Holophaga foetida]
MPTRDAHIRSLIQRHAQGERSHELRLLLNREAFDAFHGPQEKRYPFPCDDHLPLWDEEHPEPLEVTLERIRRMGRQ